MMRRGECEAQEEERGVRGTGGGEGGGDDEDNEMEWMSSFR